MDKRFKSIGMVVVAASAVILCRCSSGSLTGGGTEDVNTRVVTGLVVHQDGTPASLAKVVLLPAKYDPVRDTGDTLPTDTTDEAGRYRFNVRESGFYSTQMVQIQARTRALLTSREVQGDTVVFPVAVLSNPGTVKVMSPVNANTATGYLYIPGTTVFAYVKNSSGFVTLDSVPACGAADIAYGTDDGPEATVVRYNVSVKSEETTTVWNPGWNHSRVLSLNTAATGAGIAGTVVHFPILVRLNGETFDFTQAKSDGADLRFTRKDSTELPCEIERWDPVTELAEVWVSVDTIRGNDSMQSITMYWGNPAAANESDRRAVFDTAAGFEGVWHLGEKEGQIQDATVNGYHGKRNGRQEQAPGVIGDAHLFSGSGDYSDMGDVCNPDRSDFTVCIWLKRVKTNIRSTIISKSAGGNASSKYGWLIELDPDGAMIFFMATATSGWGEAGTFVLAADTWITDTVWHHVAVVIDRSGENVSRLYIDGTDVSILPSGGSMAEIGGVVSDAPLRLGADANGGNPWNGFLDECSIAFAARSEDWIRLSFMNQRKDNRLIVFR